jgi:hypothetical protein
LIKVESAQKVRDELFANGLWTCTAATGGCTRTYGATAVDDNHLLPTSPGIYTGTDVGLTTDYEGLSVGWGSLVNIGIFGNSINKRKIF